MTGERELQARLAALGSRDTRYQLMGKLGLRAVYNAQKLVPRKTGNLARTIRIDDVTDEHVRVAAGGTKAMGYAAHVEFGTKPHIIRPKNRRALRWATGANRRLSGTPRTGAPVTFATVVHHPGTKAHAFLVPGSKQALQEAGLADVLVTSWNRAA